MSWKMKREKMPPLVTRDYYNFALFVGILLLLDHKLEAFVAFLSLEWTLDAWPYWIMIFYEHGQQSQMNSFYHPWAF